MNGIVTKTTGSIYVVMTGDGKRYECKLKGSFRIKGIRSTNPLSVGDNVQFDYIEEQKMGLIHFLEDRKNYIIRKSTKLSKQQHVIAANIEQAVCIVTLAYPRTSTGFIDRFLAVTELYHIPAAIVFNKCDLHDEVMKDDVDYLCTLYKHIGYKCLVTSVIDNIHTEDFKALLKDKTSLLIGHSGVGKSALVNVIEPSLNLKEGRISDYHEKGKHTTTFTEMFPLSFGGFIIDTPGIKEFGMIWVNPEELGGYFPEMRELLPKCRFYNCTHVHEPDCAVKKALDEGYIDPGRYKNYLSMLNDDGVKF
ncbi:MAG TPA: ribosome small subunit-dependent GTPase A [Bacteroidales bacterium]|nr:ribosome small subunit-dependent GTPase A [Bacteroidales bacterium]HPS16417.1 ribosome small subunit-dependent GTPase A [Bacteroidales bacterium]